MEISSFLPQPVRNIYDNYHALNPNLIQNERTRIIQEITKDIFRLFLSLTFLSILVPCSHFLPLDYYLHINAAFGLISPKAFWIMLGTTFTYLAVKILIIAIQQKVFAAIPLTMIFGIPAWFFFEYYNNFATNHLSVIEDRLFMPLCDQIAMKFV